MQTFDKILLLGRPAAGKSELIDFLKKNSDEERAKLFHIGKFVELDDHPWIWEKFIEDNLWEETGVGRIYSHKEGNNYGLNPEASRLFDLMMTKFNRTISEKYPNQSDFYKDGTLFIEFSRGGESGFEKAFLTMKKEIFEKAVILYLDVSFEESWRKNVARYEEKMRHSILAHMVTKRTMEAFYKTNDWENLTGGKKEGYLTIQGVKVPFVSMKNEPESVDSNVLTPRYSGALNKLWELYRPS